MKSHRKVPDDQRVRPRSPLDETGGWTLQRVEIVRAGIDEGLSAAKIAEKIGHGCTRNAVLGRIHRMQLDEGTARRIPARKASEPKPIPAPRAVALPKVKEPTARTLEDGRPVTLEDLSSRDCKWPIGDVGSPEFHYCANAQHRGGPYCEFHAAKARGIARKPEREVVAIDALARRNFARMGM